jgi:hypothetical protein
MREEHRRDVEVILDQITFGDAELRPEELVEIRETDDPVVEFDVESVFVFREFDFWYGGFPTLLRSSFNCGRVIVTRRKFEGHQLK